MNMRLDAQKNILRAQIRKILIVITITERLEWIPTKRGEYENILD